MSTVTISYEGLEHFGMPDEFFEWFYYRFQMEPVSIGEVWQRCHDDEWLLELAIAMGVGQQEIEEEVRSVSDISTEMLGAGKLEDGLLDTEDSLVVNRQAGIYKDGLNAAILAVEWWRRFKTHTDETDTACHAAVMACRALAFLQDGDEKSILKDLVLELGEQLGVVLVK